MGGPAGRAALVRAFEAAREADDVEAMAAAALALVARQEFGAQLGRTAAFLHEAYTRASGALRVRLAAALARAWVYASEPERAVPFAGEAVTGAARYDDPALLAEALDAQLLVHWGPDDLDARLAITSRLADTVAHVTDVDARLSSHLWRLTTALEHLDPITVQRQLRALEDLATESGSQRVAFFAASRGAMWALVTGDLVQARALLAATVRAGGSAGETDTAALAHELGAQTARQAGDRDELSAQAAAFEQFGTVEGVPAVLAEAAVLWLAAGEAPRARALLDRLGPVSAVPRDVDWLLVVCAMTEVAAATGAREVVAAAHELLLPYAGRGVVNAGGVAFVGVVDDFLRMAATALGHDDEARRRAQAAAAAYDRLGAAWWQRRVAGAGRPGAGPPGLGPPGFGPPGLGGPVVAHLVPGAHGVWTVGLAGRTAPVRDMKGLRYLHLLLERPGAELSAGELSASVAGHPGHQVAEAGLDTLDRAALAAYRDRVLALDADLAEAERWSDTARETALRAERDLLLDEIAAATGLAGRVRRTGAAAERARVAVQKAVTAAITRVGEVDPALGRLLRDTVRTGTRCRYEPDPDRPVRWVLRGSAETSPHPQHHVRLRT